MPDNQERPTPMPICDDRRGSERHRWPENFADGDTCHCGRFYLRHGTGGEAFAFELERTPEE